MTDPATAPEFDDVTQDAINANAPIPPRELPQDQRRAFLGGVFGFRAGAYAHQSPYIDLDCRNAWNAGWDREERDTRGS